MRQLRAWLLRFGGLFRKARSEQEINEEIESNLQLHIEDGIQSGLSPQEARRKALIKLGGVEATREAWRERRGIPFLEAMARDVVYAMRMLGSHKGWTAGAVISLVLRNINKWAIVASRVPYGCGLMARRDEGAYREYGTEEQQSQQASAAATRR
ncbi:MAG: permease prefix domain 1-containing protein, partial [Acidobacteriota bacterium]